MTPTGRQIEAIPGTEIKGLHWVSYLKLSAAPKQRQPFVLPLVVPEA